jgi:hypothetical protein
MGIDVHDWRNVRTGYTRLTAFMFLPGGQSRSVKMMANSNSPRTDSYEQGYVRFDKRYAERAVISLLAPVIFGITFYSSNCEMTWEQFETWLLVAIRKYRDYVLSENSGISELCVRPGSEEKSLRKYKEILRTSAKEDVESGDKSS